MTSDDDLDDLEAFVSAQHGDRIDNGRTGSNGHRNWVFRRQRAAGQRKLQSLLVRSKRRKSAPISLPQIRF